MTVWRGVDYGTLTASEMLQIVDHHPQEVYFIRCHPYVKIGASKWPPNRLKQIKWGVAGVRTPSDLNFAAAELVATEPGGISREREMHAKFSHLRHTGEWFTEAPELTDYIESLGATS